jgi:hypothetical protein
VRLAVCVLIALLVTACGSGEPAAGPAGYGISLDVPEGWYGGVTRGTVRLGTVPAGAPLGADDVSVILFEYEPAPPEGPEAVAYYKDDWPARFETEDFVRPEGGTLINERHGTARRAVAVNDRLFNVFAESGVRPLSEERASQLNQALAGIRVEAGDFYRGWARPVEFPERPGWQVVSSGPTPRYAQGEYMQTAAATIPYRNDPNDLPPARTLEVLPADGILLWVSVSRGSRWPHWSKSAFEPRRAPPYRLADLERNYPWEGQVRDIPEYRMWATNADQYQVDLRVYFGQEHPTAAMRAEADAVLRGLRWPDWGPWELEDA